MENSDYEKTIAEMNEEIVRLSQEAAHWKMRSEQFAASRHANAQDANDWKLECSKRSKTIAYLEDRLLDAYGVERRRRELTSDRLTKSEGGEK